MVEAQEPALYNWQQIVMGCRLFSGKRHDFETCDPLQRTAISVLGAATDKQFFLLLLPSLAPPCISALLLIWMA